MTSSFVSTFTTSANVDMCAASHHCRMLRRYMMASVPDQSDISATHYTALTTVELLGKSIPSLCSGLLAVRISLIPWAVHSTGPPACLPMLGLHLVYGGCETGGER